MESGRKLRLSTIAVLMGIAVLLVGAVKAAPTGKKGGFEMTIHSVAGSQIKVKERNVASTEARTKSVWRGKRFKDLLAVLASVAFFGGTYLLISQVVLPSMARGFAALP